jgi:hypothetical protein
MTWTPWTCTIKVCLQYWKNWGIEIRLECRCLQKCFLIWNFYVGCLWAPLLVLTQSKETVFWSNLVVFLQLKQDSDNFSHSKLWENHTFWWVFSVIGAHNQQVLCMFKCGKTTTKGACSSPISMIWGLN